MANRRVRVQEFDAIKERVRQAVNIVDVVADHVTLRAAGKDFVGLCPFHKDRKPSLTVSPSKQIFKCFACGAGGDVFSFVQRRENVTFPEAVKMLADRAGIPWEPRMRGSSESGYDRTALASVNAWAREHFQARLSEGGDGSNAGAGTIARAYLVQRGISEEMWDRFGIGLALDSYEDLLHAGRRKGFDAKLLAAAGLVKTGKAGGYYDTFRNRLMFPIADATSRVIGFGGRTLGDDAAKYLNTPETALFDKGRQLYGLDLARRAIGEKGRAIVVEGYTDCVMAHQFGFTETVATLGTALTENHGHLLRRYTEAVVLLFDSDEAGRKAADRALSAALGGRLSVRVASVPEGKDPCDYLLSAGAEAFDAVIGSAVDAFEFKWQQVYEAHHGSTSSSSKRAAIESFIDALLAANRSGTLDVIDLGLLMNQLSPLLGLPPDAIHRLLTARRQRRDRAARSSGAARSPGAAGASEDSVRAGRQEPAGSANAEQAALNEILEVLINEPALYDGIIKEHFRPERFVDRFSARIGQEVRRLAETLGEFSLVELLERFEESAIADRITDLQAAGERRGRYLQRLDAAVQTLQRVEQSRRAAEAGQTLLKNEPDGNDSQAVEQALRAMHAGAHNQHHFAPRRAIPFS